MENIEMNHMDLNQQTKATNASEKFSVPSLINYIDRSLLQSIQNVYRLKQDGLDIIEFSRFFINCIEHHQEQTIFLAASLSQLFELIAQGNTKIKFSQITDFICEKILQKDSEQNEVVAHWIPLKGRDKKNPAYLKNPPILKGSTNEQVYKVWMGQSVHDKGKHDNIINQAYFSQSKSKIYCLQSLADWIGVYTPEAKLEYKIRPSSFKVKKDSAVLSIAFSESQQRLGAVLKDFSISFWDAFDNFGFEKSIPTAKYCQQLQSAIWYLQYFQKWVTGDMVGVIYIWNLAQQKPEKTMKCKGKSRINDLCEIPSISALAVVQQQRGAHNQSTKIQLLSLIRGDTLAQIDTRNDRRMLHTLRYSQEYQILLSAGFQKRISLFQINTTYLDTSLKGQLLGHESAITSFTLVKKTPMVVSADDKGKVKIWNIRNLKCMQTIDFTDKVIITKVLDLSSQNKIAVLGSRITLLYFERPPEEISEVAPLRVKQLNDSLYVFTSRDIRQLDLKDGKLQKIDCHYNSQSYQMTSIIMSSKGQVITGNQKGQINIYNNTTGKWLQHSLCHSGPIHYMEEDTANNLLISASDHNGFVVSRYRIECLQEIRSVKGNFIGKEISSVVFSSYHSIIAFISAASVFILDYKQLRIQYQIQFSQEFPVNLSLINGLALLLVGTSKGLIHIVDIEKEGVRPFLSIKASSFPVNHIISDLKCRHIDDKLLVQSNQIYCTDQRGSLKFIDITEQTKAISFKNCQLNNASYNPYRQIRQNFQLQLKKGKFTLVKMKQAQQRIFDGKIINMGSHEGGISSLGMVQFDQHLLVSTGIDNRIKIWLNASLVGDMNINKPLPYVWNLCFSQNKKFTKNILQGIELIQAIFKRFGKDISIGESQIFKLTNDQPNSYRNTTTQLKRKKPTLLQDQFNVIDLNYQKIKRQKLLPINGPTLKRMEITKNIQSLQKEWQSAKEKQQQDRDKLLKSIQTKAYKNQERDTVVTMLKDRSSNQQTTNNTPLMLSLFQQKLQSSIQPTTSYIDSFIRSTPVKQIRQQTTFRYSSKKMKNSKGFQGRKTFENYFTKKYQTLTNSLNQSPEKASKESSYKKQNNFRLMLKQMRQKLTKSKKQHTNSQYMRPQTQPHTRHQSSGLLRQFQHF